MKFFDTFFLALRSVLGNRLRTFLTVAIIALGIMALVGIFTAIESIKSGIYSSFASMGANGFTIRNREMIIRVGGGGGGATKGNTTTRRKVKVSNRNKIIKFEEAMAFKNRFAFPSMVTVSFRAGGGITVYNGDKKTNPNVQVIGGDENYLRFSGYDLQQGRDFNSLDVESGRNVAVLGVDVAKKLFGEDLKNVDGSSIRVGNVRYRVIGVLKSKGNSGFMSADNVVLTTVSNTRRVFIRPNASYNIGVNVNDIKQMDVAIGEATGTMRIIRKLALDEENNFYIAKSDSVAEVLFRSLGMVTYAAILIGFITLFGSAIGLMNIMLVSVAERTREIGVNKALGATASAIRMQFLLEAILISVMGGILGVLLGMTVGNVMSLLLKTAFIVPWLWISLGILLCASVGLISGLYPAIKASRLDPIVALRYE
ncbi:ABC transporter permease [uncultured Chitinophaga sp.]|uniref:ABC transporter permease n=1 Tax=uncultured Chitinophaga sp. TaxID=339340 RepID=UPI0025E4D1D2|nr:ABC transporter permease [uncultured Chitinophaga sp.]